MTEELLVRLAAPTLAGIKTGSLFACPYTDRQAILCEVRALNRVLTPKGLCLLPIRFLSKRVLLYLYRPAKLQHDLQNDLACDILRQAGYCHAGCCGGCGKSIACLVRRVRENAEFPHEIGLFLGYPPEDVQGFIQHNAEDFKYAGLWKVYGDEEYARRLFAKFKKCTQIYCSLWQTGLDIGKLAVNV